MPLRRMCGQGHTLTPVAVAVISAALLTWKESFTGISLALTEAELRSAIVLAILAFMMYSSSAGESIRSLGHGSTQGRLGDGPAHCLLASSNYIPA